MTGEEPPRLFESPSVPANYRRHLLPTVFEPWAARLVEAAGLRPGQTVLDVASGTGAVARAAAAAVGATGRVIASDISGAMLAEVSVGADPAGAPIRLLEASATELTLAGSSVDVVLCQHGLPFVRDKARAVAELRRVLRPGGTLGIVVWLADTRLEPFDSYGDILRAEGGEAPFPRAWDYNSFKMSIARLEELLGGFPAVRISTETRELRWPTVDAAVNGIFGTPYGPPVAALEPDSRQRALAELRRRMELSPNPVNVALVALATR